MRIFGFIDYKIRQGNHDCANGQVDIESPLPAERLRNQSAGHGAEHDGHADHGAPECKCLGALLALKSMCENCECGTQLQRGGNALQRACGVQHSSRWCGAADERSEEHTS